MEKEPKILMPHIGGFHNSDIGNSTKRLEEAKSYQDLSTVILCPVIGDLPPIVVQSWMGMLRPMNQKVLGPLFLQNMEVAEAYNQGVKMILDNPDLRNWKYILTLEHDNLPPPDGLLKLYEGMDKYDVVGGLYWTKGEGGQPMIYGNPKVFPRNFLPQKPLEEQLHPANGLGMGFNLFKMEVFKKMPYPWFKTIQEHIPNVGSKVYTQDLYFYEQAAMAGFKFACDTRVKVGHYDNQTHIIW